MLVRHSTGLQARLQPRDVPVCRSSAQVVCRPARVCAGSRRCFTAVKRSLPIAGVAMVGEQQEAVQQEPGVPVDALAEARVPDAPPMKEGDIVYGEVEFSNGKGARVKLIYHDRLFGYMPIDQSPGPSPWAGPLRMRYEAAANNSRQQGQGQGRSRQQPQGQGGRRQNAAAAFDDAAAAPAAEEATEAQPAAGPGPGSSRTGGRQQQGQGAGSSARAPKVNPRENVVLPSGHTRPFKVLAIPPNMGPEGKGPLLSAFEHDTDLLMWRMQQLKEFGDETNSTFKAEVVSSNSGGLVMSLAGFGRAFLPWSQMLTRPSAGAGGLGEGGHGGSSQEGGGRGHHYRERVQWDDQSIRAELVGRQLEVGILEVMHKDRRVMLSERKAQDLRLKRMLQLGAVVAGTVHTVRDFGAFVALDGAPWKHALLRTDAITQGPRPPRDARSVFAKGERVVGLVCMVSPDYEKVSISTMELEQKPGDMLAGPAVREQCFAAVARHITK